MSRFLKATIALILFLPFVCSAQTVFPNRGGTGTTTIPAAGQVLVGFPNGTYGPVATSSLGIVGSTGLATSSIDTEAKLEAVLTDVLNVLTDNDSTSDLPEGSNLYFTIGRVQAALTAGYNAVFGNATATNATTTHLAVTGSFSLLGTVITNVGTWFSNLFDSNFAGKDTGDLAEGSNLYFTNARSRSSISESATGLDYSSASGVLSLTSGYSIPRTASTTEWAATRGVVAASSTLWDTAYAWGDHAAAGYLSEENDPVFGASEAADIDAADISGWNAAYSWGNHATAGYLTSIATTTVRGMFSANSPVTYNSGTGAIGFSNPGYITGVAWGDIGGTLSSQADLQTALKTKLGTTTAWTAGNLVRVVNGGTVQSVATSSLGLPTFVDLVPLLSTTTAAATYYPISNPSGFTSNTGTVTSVGLTTPTGLSASGSPVTSSGSLGLSWSSGYGPVRTASTTEWATAYGWGDHSQAGYLTNITGLVTDGLGISLTGSGTSGDPYVVSASGGGGSGLATSSPWTNGNLAYVTGMGSVGSVATGTLTTNATGLELNATRALVGGSAVLSLTSGYAIPLSASTTEWANARTLTNLLNSASSSWNAAYSWGNHATAGYLTSIATSTVRGMVSAGTGLSYSGGEFANTGVTSIGGLIGDVATSSLGLQPAGDYVAGPTSASNNRVVVFDGTTGKLVKDSGMTYSSTILSLGGVQASSNISALYFNPNGSTASGNSMYLPAANTLGWAISSTGEMRLTSTALSPNANDGNALGTAALSWADLFLASGAVVNFANSNYTLTHSSGLLTASGNLTVSGLLSATTISSSSLGSTFNGLTAKTTPADNDMIGLMDSAASNVLKKFSWANLKTAFMNFLVSSIPGYSADTVFTASTTATYGVEWKEAGGGGGVTITSAASTTLSITTNGSQRVVVMAKGDLSSVTSGNVYLRYDGTQKDTVNANGGGNGGHRSPFYLIYTETPPAGTKDVTVTTDTNLQNVVITAWVYD